VRRLRAEAGLTHDPGWLTVKAVAVMLSVSPRQVWKWIACGQFEVKKFGPKITRVSRASIERFIEKQPAA
jgi:predicted DNA-binding transcriptional regulator AlpA